MEMLDLVHKLASLSQTSPFSSISPTATSDPSSSSITTIGFNNTYQEEETDNLNDRLQKAVFSQQPRHSNQNNITTVGNSPGRRIQPVSAPRRPPDIQNMTLFPPIDMVSPTNQENSGVHIKFKSNSDASKTTTTPSPTNCSTNRPPPGFMPINEKKFRRLEIKLQGRQVINDDDNNTKIIASAEPVNKILPLPCDDDNSTDKKRQQPKSTELFAEITPEIASKIEDIASDYSSLLDKNLNTNILDEISLLLQIIVSSRPLTSTELEYTNISSKIDGNLTTVAQQIYFVLKVLTFQLNSSLISIDPEIIQLLVEKYPHRIPKSFRKTFNNWIDAHKIKERHVVEVSGKPSEFHQCVTFRSETDGRSNFPSQGNFHAFCKQRDLFYSIKNLWGDAKNTGSISGLINKSSSFGNNNIASKQSNNNNKSSNNNFKISEIDHVHNKIQALFNLNSSWVNLSHFAALFSAQYIMDSMEASLQKIQLSQQDEIMKVLHLSNLDRFTKLNNRMSSISELEPKTKDVYSFFEYFIITAGSPSFNQHLIDRISFEIRQIESSLDSAESPISSGEGEEFLLKKTILLAKLLGFVSFLPYRDESCNNSNNATASLDRETLSTNHIELRKYQQPPLEFYYFICNAIQKSRLAFTLPWIIEILSFCDCISLQLPAYKEILLLICCIYKTLCSIYSTSEEESPSKLCLSNKNFVRFWCGKLFSLVTFPTSLLLNNITSETDLTEKVKSLTPNNNDSSSKKEDETDVPIDSKGFLGEQLSGFYFSVKFNQMKYILHSGLQQQQSPTTSFGNGQYRHISPMPAQLSIIKPGSKAISNEIELQRQLECSFFDGNSASIKKTVDFVSDRIASNYVKMLRKTMPDQRNELAQKRLFKENAAQICRKSMLDGAKNNYCINNKCELSLTLLIGETLSLDALKICQEITERQTIDKISQWVHTHIKAEMFPEVSLPEELATTFCSVTNDQKELSIVVADEEQLNLTFSFMISLHRTMKRLYEKTTPPVLNSTIDEILNCSALGKVPGLINTLLDFGIALISYSPSILNSERQLKLVNNLWKPTWNNDSCRLLSPRNVLILSSYSQDQNVQKHSWTRLGEIILLLIKEKMLNFETVEQDCFRLLREDLSLQESKNVSELLKKLVASTTINTTNDSDAMRSREVVDWISWYCSSEEGGEF